MPPRAWGFRKQVRTLAAWRPPAEGETLAPVTDIAAIVGPESAGKTTLAKALAQRWRAPWVAEYAREYLRDRSGYRIEHLAAIARGQMAREAQALARRPERLVLDTDLLVILVWWRERFGAPPQWLEAAFLGQPPRRYLLTRPDLPWQPDPLRESPRDRERLFDVYRAELEARCARFGIVSGFGPARLQSALAAWQQLR